ncbi:hypothetical protein RRG08_010054 [Elysia crispata]|uniref:Fibronectin type-III domain-containing protein n=1 Tax=Elysia crispata TaxID=231223 RepID=A0AAE1B7Y7_9GAST|nr:hypothetical protein RRG08_010054 [Elysia crispata]
MSVFLNSQFPAAVTDHTFTHTDILSLPDDWTYNVVVTACNLAKLCTTSTSANILVDSTPPLPGELACILSLSELVRTVLHVCCGDNPRRSTDTSNSVKLVWVGFWDSHFAVSHYLVSIGTEPFATNLNSVRRGLGDRGWRGGGRG